MFGFLRPLTDLDARAWRTALVSFLLLGGVGVVFLFGAGLLGLNEQERLESWMGAGLHGPWALPAAVGGFAAMAFLGVPQFVLIAAAVVAFGPWTGFAYSWIGTLVSALVGFALGRKLGGRALQDLSSPGVKRFIEAVGRNGFLASLLVRLVPTAPFIVVNMAAGATSMRLLSFIAGAAIGIVPKIALTAFAGNAVVAALNGGGAWRWITLGVIAAIWIGSVLVVRAWRRRDGAPLSDAESGGK